MQAINLKLKQNCAYRRIGDARMVSEISAAHAFAYPARVSNAARATLLSRFRPAACLRQTAGLLPLSSKPQ
jgi:hypothetical protein